MQLMTDVSLERAIEATAYIGRLNPFWVQGPGGNVSFKNQDKLWIKASGLRFDAMKDPSSFVSIDLPTLHKRLQNLSFCTSINEKETLYEQILKSSQSQDSFKRRPSMELGFHALLPASYVLHFHALSSILLADKWNRNDLGFCAWIKKHSPFDFQVHPQLLPGADLSFPFLSPHPQLALLSNHGVVLQSEDPVKDLESWKVFEKLFLETFYINLFLSMDTSMDDLIKQLQPCPKERIYFPDAAVFLQKIQRMFGDDPWRLTLKHLERDQDAFEIWLANTLLDNTSTRPESLDPEIFARVSTLPSEKYRLQKEPL